mmetsp:Transcript_36269/g.61312  ORF Transcript_36269/g.61312 Transcript_36269/m.61312 type:complete len:152 (-) Transcript_36269:320-775(-)
MPSILISIKDWIEVPTRNKVVMFLSSRRGLRIGTAVARISRRYQLSRSFSTEAPRYPIPPFTLETAIEKTKMAEDAWNTKDPEKVSMAYSKDSEWRNRSVFVKGRSEIKEFLTDKWKKELDYKLEKRYWCHANNRIAVRFAYEYRNADGEW